MEWGWDNARALVGIAVLFGIAWLLSERKKDFPIKIVLGAVAMQFAFALILFGVPWVREGLFKANIVVNALQEAARAGTGFVYGYVGDNTQFAMNPTGIPGDIPPPLFFFQILPIIIVVAALSAMLWHWRILRWITKGFAAVFSRLMGISGATSLAVSANVFMGMTEAPILVKPYLKNMSRSELFIMMTAGFATIAGSLMVVFGIFLGPVMDNPIAQLLTASFMAAPAAVAVALVIIPEKPDAAQQLEEPDFGYQSTMDAFSTGASDGMKIVINIATMLIAAFAILHIANMMLAWFGSVAGFSPWETAKTFDIAAVPESWGMPELIAGAINWLGVGIEWVGEIVSVAILWVFKALLYPFAIMQNFAGEQVLSIQYILGWVFAPLMYMIGVPMEEARMAGSLMGVKTVLTEFIAFIDLSSIPRADMDPRTRIITLHALCGFANFGSIGILIGGLSIIEPERRETFLALAWKTLVAGTLATLLSGAVVGALPAELFLGH